MGEAKDQKVAIDIQYKKLLEALIDRKIVPYKWTDQVRSIQAKLESVKTEIPWELASLQHLANKETLNYYDCKEILQALEDACEGKSTNFLGQYNSPTMSSVYRIIKAYEKNNAFAAEGARVLSQNTMYEIPSIKRKIQQNEKLVGDNNRKIVEYTKSIADCKRKLETMCQDLEIEGVHFEKELQALVQQLPVYFQSIIETACSLDIETACEYYNAMQDYLHSCDPPEVKVKGKSKKIGKPQKHELSGLLELKTSPDDEAGETITSEYTGDQQQAESDDAISYNITSSEAIPQEGAVDLDIDWDITTEAVEEQQPVDIEWDISTTSADITTEAGVDIDWDISTETTTDASALLGGSIGTGTKLQLLKSTEFRNKLKNDLLELQTFFRQRKIELQSEDAVAYSTQFQGSPAILSQQSVEKVDVLLDEVNLALSKLEDKRLMQLLMIQQSSRYLQRLVSSLRQHEIRSDKVQKFIDRLEDKNVDLIDVVSKSHPELEKAVKATKELKAKLEESLVPLFKGHQVNIIGEINQL